jgi:hypothetical protein
MAELLPEDPGLLGSFLDELALGGYATRNIAAALGNLIQGDTTGFADRLEGAGRNALDFGGNLIDAVAPGDWIKPTSRAQDKPEFSDLIGGMDDGWAKFGVNLVGNTLTDPLSLVPGAVVAKGLGGVGRAVGAGVKAADKILPGTADVARNALLGTKSALGWLKPAMPEAQEALEQASNAKSLTNQAGQAEVQRILKGTTDQERQDVFDILQNIGRSPTGVVGQLAPIQATGFMTPAHQLEEFSRRAAMTGKDPAHIQRLNEIAQQLIPYTHNQWAEGVQKGVFSPNRGVAEIPDALGNTIKEPWEIDAEQMSPGLYAQRTWQDAAEQGLPAGGGMQATKPRELHTGQDIADELALGGMARGTTLESDIGNVAAQRAGQQANLVSRAALMKSLLGPNFKHISDPDNIAEMNEIIANMRGVDPEGAKLIEHAYKGLPAQGNLMAALHSASRVFKPAAVAGVGIPRVGSIVKNLTGFPQQLAMQGEWKEAGRQIARTPATLAEAARKTVQGYGGNLPATAIGKDADAIEAAFAAGGGRADNVIQHLEAQGRGDLADALEHGAIDGFISAEVAQNNIRNSGFVKNTLGKFGVSEAGKERIGNALDAPGRGFQGAEQAGRLATFKSMREDLMAQGVPREEAARQAAERVSNALYSYETTTPENRALRTVIPFGAFQTNAIRQGANFLAKNPAAAVAASSALGQHDNGPVYPSMQGKLNIPLGMDETGHQGYITSLGLPLEALGNIPNPSADLPDFGRQIEQDIVGSSHPLLKTAYETTSSRNPFFGTDSGYDRIAGQSAGATGRVFNKLAGTGLIQPLTSPVGQIGNLLDDRGTLPEDLLGLLTGARIAHVDEDVALRQQLDEALKRNPEIKSYTNFYAEGDNPEAEDLLRQQAEAKKRIRQKRKLAESQ